MGFDVSIERNTPTTQMNERLERRIRLVQLLSPDRQDYLIDLAAFELSRAGITIPSEGAK